MLPTARLATYAAASEPRRNMRAAGLIVARYPGAGGKREMTIAAKTESLARHGDLAQEIEMTFLIKGRGLSAALMVDALLTHGVSPDAIWAQGHLTSPAGSLAPAALLNPLTGRSPQAPGRRFGGLQSCPSYLDATTVAV